MKRTFASVAAAGLLTFGLAACGGDDTETEEPAAPVDEATEEPAEEETTEEEAPAEEETTEEPTEEETTEEAPAEEETTEEPDDGGASSAPEGSGDAAEWCANVAELATGGGIDPSQFATDPEAAIQFLEDMREGAPAPVAENLDVLLENVEAAMSGDLENVDQEALMQASTDLQGNITEACAGSM